MPLSPRKEHMRRARPRVLWALSSLQGWVKGIDARRNFRERLNLPSAFRRFACDLASAHCMRALDRMGAVTRSRRCQHVMRM